MLLEGRDIQVLTVAETEIGIDGFMSDWVSDYMGQWHDTTPYFKDPSILKGIGSSLSALEKAIDSVDKTEVSVLDAGCYGGYVYDWLEWNPCIVKSIKYTGVDISETAIREAVRHHPQSNATFHCMNLLDENLSQEIGRYDIVFCSRVLLHIPDMKKAISNLEAKARHTIIFGVRLSDKNKCERKLVIGTDRHIYFRTVTKDYMSTEFPQARLYAHNRPTKDSVYTIQKGNRDAA